MKKRLFSLLHKLGLTRLAAWMNRRRVVILCYHGVTARAERAADDPAGLHIRARRFEEQLDYLRSNYNIISLTEYLAARREERALPARSVVLTFDDGYRNFLTMAASRLEARGLPASVFLITDWVRRDGVGALESEWTESDDRLGMTWKEINALCARGVEFGSHTCSHPKLPALTIEEATREMEESRAIIGEHLDGNGAGASLPFAYPYGAYTLEVVERARESGYSCALTTDAGPNDAKTDLFLLRRMLIGDDDDVPALAARVSGLAALLAHAFKSR
jgi:peptidoglycan/xylan/chitin deacetylase (PgdA/CDA1 family)